MGTVRTVTDQEVVVGLQQVVKNSSVGLELAARVAEALIAKPGSGNGFAYDHRDFCGDTVYFQDGAFHIASVNDGRPCGPYASFASEAGFVAWLDGQTDRDLMGYTDGKLKK